MEIQFPNLFGGLTFQINNVAFYLFGNKNIPIFWYGIIIAIGFALAVFLGTRVCKNFGLTQDDVIDLVLFAIPSAIIGARAYYVIFSWSQFSDNPIKIFNPRTGGLAIYGGVIGAFIAAYFVAKYKKISLLKLFDFGVPYLVLAQGIGRWGNFVNQEAFGSKTSLPWGMTGSVIGNEPVHPTFLYESLWCLGVFFFLIWFRKNKKKVEGEVFFLYMILYGVGRMFIEGLRTDSLMVGSLRISQVLALAFALTFSVLFYLRRKKFNNNLEESYENVPSKYADVLEKLKEDANQNNDTVEEGNIGGEAEEISEEAKIDEVENDFDKSTK
jgi:phosphatidylglycerol---prolipoprotein diacylglyceryl transferase